MSRQIFGTFALEARIPHELLYKTMAGQRDVLDFTIGELRADMREQLHDYDRVERELLDADFVGFATTQREDHMRAYQIVTARVPVIWEEFDVFEQLDRIPAFIGRRAEECFGELAWKLGLA